MRRKWTKHASTKTMAWVLAAAMLTGACPIATSAEEEKEVSEEETQETSEEEAEDSTDTVATEETSEEETLEEETSEENSEEETDEEETTEESTEDSTEEETKASLLSSARIGNVTKTCPTIGDNGEVTFHYYPSDDEKVTSAYVKGSWDGSWGVYFDMSEDENGVWSVTTDQLALDTSYEYGIVVNDNWVGDPTNPRNGGNSQILRNPVANSDGSVTIFYYPQGDEDVTLYYKEEDDSSYASVEMTADANHSALLSATVSETGTYSYYFTVDGTETEDKNCKDASFTISKLPEDDASVKSPVIDGKKVTFSYFAPTAKAVYVAGNMNDWNASKNIMSYQAKTGFWILEMELDPGDYQYKFVVDGSWVTDPRNEVEKDSNSAFTIEMTDDDVKSPVMNANNTTVTFNYYNKTASTVTLAGSMNGWDKAKNPMSYDSETGFWTISMKLEPGTYEYKFVVDDNDWKNDPRNSEKASNGNSLLTIEEKAYTYHIYYYTKDFSSADAAKMWIWQDGTNGIEYDFDEFVTLEDGNEWLLADVNVDLSAINIIPKAAGTWNGQDSTKVFANTNDDKNVTIYLIDDDTKVYTELPDVTQEVVYDRYVMIEYERENGDYDGWNIYSWNTGIKSEYVVDFTEIDGKMVAFLPVDNTKESVSFCMRRSEEGNPWAEKDGGDHNVSIPLDQNYVKAQFVQGEGIVGNLPYNTGYETVVKEQKVSFYYRDDEKYKAYTEDELEGKVSFVYDGKDYEMSYDADNERYVAVLDLEAGQHAYGYKVDGELVLDKYNTNTTVVDGTTYSLFEYKTFELAPTASVEPGSINYNQNAVLTVSLGEGISEDLTVAEIYADLSALGQSSKFAIDPALLEGTIAVKDTVSAGKKNIPVTIIDQYGNAYETEASVTVTKRYAGNDFDWDEAVIYFAVTDRFFDGNSANNDAYGTGSYDLTQGSMYHGGDFAGLTQKLDYLQSLGVNTVWITPIVENTEYIVACDGYAGQTNAGYHGYWASDFQTLNKHLGTEEEFSQLISELHKRGMKLMVDVVLNHAGYTTEDLFNNTFIEGKNMLRDSSTTVKGDDKKDALSNLPDFVTEDPDVRALLVEWQTSWISNYDIDYYRVDTVKHVDDITWKAFKNALTKENPSFKMIGEYAGAGYATSFGQLGTGQMDSLLDFDFNDQALNFCSGKLTDVEKFLENRNSAIDNTATMGSFIGSHDEDGFMYRLEKERGFNADTAYALSKVAATLQITAKGQPVIYYGEELGLTGANNYPYQDNRYDFAWDKANSDNDMLNHYKTLLNIRNEYTDVFAKGTRSTAFVDDAEGILVAERSYGEDALLVAMNINTEEKTVSLEALQANTSYIDLYADKVYKTDATGTLTVTIPSAQNGGTMILKKTAKQDIVIDISDVVNTGNSDSNTNDSSASVITTVSEVTRVTEPTFKNMDGTVVRGWDNVVKAYIESAEQEQVPLASNVLAAQRRYIDITLDKNVIKMIPQSSVKLMAESGADFRFVFGKDVAYTFDHATLAGIKGNLNMNVNVTTDKDFGQGFKAIVLDPATDINTDTRVSMAVQVGAENAGKVAFLFRRNRETAQMEPAGFIWIDANGGIAVHDAAYTDFVILY